MTSFLEATFQLTLNTNGSSSSVIQSGDLKAIFSSSKEAVEVACKALQSVYSGDECMAICPNADLSGLGVKVAFYLQSILNATLVIFCPGEGASGAWSSAVLTAALVIPASIQLFQKDITLYHANLVLLFATLSTVTSLAVAPIIPIWRQGVSSELGEINTRQWREELEETPEAGPLTEKAFNERTGRVVLAVALLFQMIMQWMWCLFLWGLPGNFSGACSGETRFFWYTKAKDTNHLAWTFWLIFCLGLTLGWAVIMVFSCHSSVHDLPLMHSSPESDYATLSARVSSFDTSVKPASMVDRVVHGPLRQKLEIWIRRLLKRLFPRDEHFRTRVCIRISQLGGLFCSFAFIMMSELQTAFNRPLTYDTENVMRGFSQFAAVLLAIAPAWPLTVAFMKARNRARRAKSGETDSVQEDQQPPYDINSPNPPSPVLLRSFNSPDLNRKFPTDYFGQVSREIVYRIRRRNAGHRGEPSVDFTLPASPSRGMDSPGATPEIEPYGPQENAYSLSQIRPSRSSMERSEDGYAIPIPSSHGSAFEPTLPPPVVMSIPSRSQDHSSTS